MRKEKVTLSLPRDVLEHARRAAAVAGETLDEFVRAAVTDRLSRLTTLSAERRRAAAAEWAD